MQVEHIKEFPSANGSANNPTAYTAKESRGMKM